MRISYHEDTDSMYIHLSDRPTDESEEIAPDTIAHFDQDGELTGIEFYSDFGAKFGLETVEVSGLGVADADSEAGIELAYLGRS